MLSAHDIGTVFLIGVGATVVMDAWLVLLGRLGVPTTNWGLVGRWVGHMPRGQFAHAPIAKAPAVRGELALGWMTHYVIGIAYAAGLIAWVGAEWAEQPTFVPALAFGLLTVVAPLFVMQPAMGSGFLALKTPAPLRNCLRSIANHSVFGAGMYFAAVAIAQFPR
ncbi:DUF2938 domain-containing protein [Ramlibacter monticola]|uniref:DUF2938 domain-containing protein n=1 Tax=Ramlibacter monticola TaxID=1926872 RepID=A0A937CT36_9BURK|nr:DUF2938 domain-containing protein [Ramlibacter monticola]MBL0391188.1 DUF2938 domain-containing protein [Ramlibacter monticola]